MIVLEQAQRAVAAAALAEVMTGVCFVRILDSQGRSLARLKARASGATVEFLESCTVQEPYWMACETVDGVELARLRFPEAVGPEPLKLQPLTLTDSVDRRTLPDWAESMASGLERACLRIAALEAHVRRLEEDQPAADSCDMRTPLPVLGEEIGEEADTELSRGDDYDPSPDCNCETCPRGGPYTCIRHD